MKTVFLLILNLCILCQCQVIEIQNGLIQGATRISDMNRHYFSFQRIPFMKPPIGKLRFRDPETPSNWTGVLDCTREGPRFPQVDFTFEPPFAPLRGDLDSMHINVFTNNLNPTKKYPVMVWIHGGGFRTGSASTDLYGPDYFMERDIVLVTFNYRLYTFGYLSLDDERLGIPGNAGFKDQVMALQWVKDNIENFGGDSSNITIFGQSSGGGCSHYHIVSPLSQNLFQRSIIMSGSAFNPMYGAIPRRNWAYRLAVSMNYTGSENEAEILAFLEVAEPRDIFEAAGNLMTPYERGVERLLNAFGPVVEPYDNGNAFMLEHPFTLATKSWGNDIDIMIGANSFETGSTIPLFLQMPQFIPMFADPSSYVPYFLNKSAEDRAKYGELLGETYYGLIDPSPTNFEGVNFLSSEFAFWHVIDLVVKQRISSAGKGLNWVYRFDADADNNCFRSLHSIDRRWHGHLRAIHMDELCYLFKTSFTAVPEVGSVSHNLIHHMLDVFTTFSASGDPGVSNWNTSVEYRRTLRGYNIRETRDLDSFGDLPEMRRIHVWEKIYGIGVDVNDVDNAV